jgi:NTP pyrophosphatase (non-canonical NTP hydrolase)
MNLDYYQERVHDTAVYPPEVAQEYLALGLVGEAGEIANKIKKRLRGDFSNDKDITDLHKFLAMELGDCLWYIAELANELGYSLSTIAIMNIQKLAKRKATGKLKGSGDDR